MFKKTVFKKDLVLSISIWTLTVISCTDQQSPFRAVKRFDGKWAKNIPAVFDFNIDQLQEERDFLFVLRHNDAYEFSNIFLFVETQYPDGTSKLDTLEYELTHKDGRWKSVGLGRTKEITLRFKEKASMKECGPYKITVLQGMRRDTLHGIEDLSLIIDKSQSPHPP